MIPSSVGRNFRLAALLFLENVLISKSFMLKTGFGLLVSTGWTYLATERIMNFAKNFEWPLKILKDLKESINAKSSCSKMVKGILKHI